MRLTRLSPAFLQKKYANAGQPIMELGAKNEYETMALELGHGVGIAHWSKPVIGHQCSIEYPEIIEENMHFAVETYYGRNGQAARIEEQLVVTKDGCRVITKFPCEEPVACWKY